MHVHFNMNVRTKRRAGKTDLCQRKAELLPKNLIMRVGNKDTIKLFGVTNITLSLKVQTYDYTLNCIIFYIIKSYKIHIRKSFHFLCHMYM